MKDFLGCLKRPNQPAISIDDMNEAIAKVGGTEFVSFDSKAVKKLKAQRKKARLL